MFKRKWTEIPLSRLIVNLIREHKDKGSVLVRDFFDDLEKLLKISYKEYQNIQRMLTSPKSLKKILEYDGQEDVYRMIFRNTSLKLLLIENLTDYFLFSAPHIIRVSYDYYFVTRINLLPSLCLTTGFPVTWRFWGKPPINSCVRKFDYMRFESPRCELSNLSTIITRQKKPKVNTISAKKDIKDLVAKYVRTTFFLVPPYDIYSPGIFPLFLHDKYSIHKILSIYRTVIRIRQIHSKIPSIIPRDVRKELCGLTADYLTLKGSRRGTIYVSDELVDKFGEGKFYNSLIVTIFNKENNGKEYILPLILAAQPEVGVDTKDIEAYEAIRELITIEIGKSYINNERIFYTGIEKEVLTKRVKNAINESFVRRIFLKNRTIATTTGLQNLIETVLRMHHPLIQESKGRLYYVHIPFLMEDFLLNKNFSWKQNISSNAIDSGNIFDLMRQETVLKYSGNKMEALAAVSSLLLSTKRILKNYLS